MAGLWSVLLIVISMVVCLILWVHLPFGGWTYPVMACVLLLAVAMVLGRFGVVELPKAVSVLYVVGVLSIFAWLGLMRPSHDRDWNPEVAHIVDYYQDAHSPNIITVKHVRNFHWRGEHDYDIDWQSRTYDLNELDSMDLVLSIWDNENIAHTLITFGFRDGQRLVFSVEIRKEVGEEFSSLGGFVRQFELSIIAADEKDIIYTRSNIRKESVYLYPLTYDKAKMQKLFLAYLQQGRALNDKPKWYDTITSNCTTVIYQLVRMIDEDARFLLWDYRVLVSGRLPSYLLELGVIRPKMTADEYKQLAHINPKVAMYDKDNPISSEQFSNKIRENLPKP